MNPDWLYTFARYRARLADRRALVAPSWSWFASATDADSELLLQLIDLAEDKAARQTDIESTVECLLDARGLDAPDDQDAKWIVVYGLATEAIRLDPRRTAHFLGRMLPPSDPDFRLIGGFLATIDDIDDGVIDAREAELEIVRDFASARPALAAMAWERLDTNPRTRWVLEILGRDGDPSARIA
ncbi:hypothetical protein [Microbacterium sp. 22242]|uniref:hypothetical protein n=1 Tax=Microbacterium sp. 22242 TaxID=3453896 RepID=UPI003F8693ED